MKVVLFHLTGNANVKGVAYGLANAGLLYEYDVTIAAFQGSILDKIANISLFSDIRRRRLDNILKPYTHTWPWLEAGRIVFPKTGLSRLTELESAPFFVDKVVQNLDRRVARRLAKAKANGATAVYGYEDTTIHAFRRAKQLGMACLYDLPIGYWRAAQQLLEAEKERWPEWSSTITILHDAKDKLDRKEEELQLADQIFVASSFTASTLQYHKGGLGPVHVIPYGFPNVNKQPKTYDYDGKRALKLLFVGSLSQRKGIADLFAAVNHFKDHIQLTVVGQKPPEDCRALNAELSKHKWIPSLPHHSILQLMQEHDVFVFPSLFEGFGLVITEAMSQGTPVITTDRTAGPDIIQHGENGWLIPAGNTAALQNAINNLLSSPAEVEKAGLAARETAIKRPWKLYEQEMAIAVSGVV